MPEKLDIYNRKYVDSSLSLAPYFSKQFRYLLSVAGKRKKNEAVLDLGGGTGEYSLALQDMGYDVTLFDFSKAAVERARRIGVKKTICEDFATCFLGDKNFDVVMAKGFSPLNTDQNGVFDRCMTRIMTMLNSRGVFIYWGVSDLSGNWSGTGWYNCTVNDLKRYFDTVLIFPAFRYGCRLPFKVNNAITRLIMKLPYLPRALTIIGLKYES